MRNLLGGLYLRQAHAASMVLYLLGNKLFTLMLLA